MTNASLRELRQAIAAIPADVSNDAVGAHAPKLEDIFAPASHAAALDPSVPIVVGSRGAGKSFWSGVLGQEATRSAASIAYPNLGLDKVVVGFGFTGAVGGELGVTPEMLDSLVPPESGAAEAKAFWWATVLRAAARAKGDPIPKWRDAQSTAKNWEQREEELQSYDRYFESKQISLLVVYDALDTVASTWSRRRILTETLMEVVWGLRAYRRLKPKLFLRPDQIDDDALRFVELPKLRTGAVRLSWTKADLYGLLYARMFLTNSSQSKKSFEDAIRGLSISVPDHSAVLSRGWTLTYDVAQQSSVMTMLAGPYMADGVNGHKKGRTYDWPFKHLADAFDEVTPRSFLGLMIAAAGYGAVPSDKAITPEGIRHGLRAASKTRVDQLHQDFPWIKGVLAPLAGLLLPQSDKEVFRAWRATHTVKLLIADAKQNRYLPPFDASPVINDERPLLIALMRIGVMFVRKDGRVDMPDLFRVAAKLLKKGGTTPS